MAIFKGAGVAIVTPMREDGTVNFEELERIIDFQIENGTDAIIICGTTGESAVLTDEEHMECFKVAVNQTKGRVPVIASGHISDGFAEQAEELRRIAETGVDAVIMITNRLAGQDESDEVWLANLKKLLAELPEDIKLGFYECPYPYKRVLTKEMTAWCAQTGRFYFLKDTSCDIRNILDKLEVCRGTNLKLYNANTATLLESLKAGAAGYSGVMANMQCGLYSRLTADYGKQGMEELADMLTLCALIEYQCYPVNAKYYLNGEGVAMTTVTRTKKNTLLTETFRKEMEVLRRITGKLEEQYLRN